MIDLSRPIFDKDFKSGMSFQIGKLETHKKIMFLTRKLNFTYKTCAVSSPSIPMPGMKFIRWDGPGVTYQ